MTFFMFFVNVNYGFMNGKEKIIRPAAGATRRKRTPGRFRSFGPTQTDDGRSKCVAAGDALSGSGPYLFSRDPPLDGLAFGGY
jgi:hypothetical protein